MSANFGINIGKKNIDKQVAYYYNLSGNKEFSTLIAEFNEEISNVNSIDQFKIVREKFDDRAVQLKLDDKSLLCFFAFTATAVKSYEYWTDNINKWDRLTTSFNSSNTQKRDRNRDACVADANGIVQGALTGALSGLSGGIVGTILGAFVGSFYGGMCGSAFSYFGWDFK